MQQQSYYAIIGDIIHSKDIRNREEVQQNLQCVLNKLNEGYAQMIASKFTITLGDEFQVLLMPGADIISMMIIIEHALYPYKVRFAIGYGKISTTFDPNISIGADGPAYYSARSAMDYIKSNNLKNQTSYKDTWFCVYNVDDSHHLLEFINVLFTMVYTIKNTWTINQRNTIYEMLVQKNQTKVALHLGILQSSVNRRLAAGNYYSYLDAINKLTKAFAKEIDFV